PTYLLLLRIFLCTSVLRRELRSCPTRRSSDLARRRAVPRDRLCGRLAAPPGLVPQPRREPAGHRRGRGLRHRREGRRAAGGGARDRKSTRLNSSRVKISYAVFCLNKRTDEQEA